MAQKNVKRFISQAFIGYTADMGVIVKNLVEYVDGSTGFLYHETKYGGMQGLLQEECPFIALALPETDTVTL